MVRGTVVALVTTVRGHGAQGGDGGNHGATTVTREDGAIKVTWAAFTQ